MRGYQPRLVAEVFALVSAVRLKVGLEGLGGARGAFASRGSVAGLVGGATGGR